MPIVKLFQKGPVDLKKDSNLEISLLETEINIFMLQPDVVVHQINGPYVCHLPPKLKGEPERVIYTANVSYDKK